MIFLDYDGVFVAFEKAGFKLFDREYREEDYPHVEDITEALGVGKKKFWNKVDNAGVSFWAFLEKYSWSDDLFELVKDHCLKMNTDWRILSAPSLNSTCAMGKVESFQNHFGYHFRKYILAPAADKPLLCSSNEDVLIDDRESTILKWRDAGGFGILFPQPWNSNRGILGMDKLKYVEEQLAYHPEWIKYIEA